jgi:hypothetical protein
MGPCPTPEPIAVSLRLPLNLCGGTYLAGASDAVRGSWPRKLGNAASRNLLR